MPRPACGAVETLLALGEKIEDPRQQVGGDAGAVVADPHHRPPPSLRRTESAMCPRGSVNFTALRQEVSRPPARAASRRRRAGRGPGGSIHRQLLAPWPSASGRAGLGGVPHAPSARSSGSRRSSILPWVMRETSSRSSTIRTRCCDLPPDDGDRAAPGLRIVEPDLLQQRRRRCAIAPSGLRSSAAGR